MYVSAVITMDLKRRGATLRSRDVRICDTMATSATRRFHHQHLMSIAMHSRLDMTIFCIMVGHETTGHLIGEAVERG